MSYSIFLVEDENHLNDVLTSYLQKEGWNVTSFTSGEQAKRAIKNAPHLWVLDIMLPDIDGFELLREIKATSPEVPVIFISARDEDLDRILGLELGSDDYLAKPFLPRELVIRTKKLLERAYGKKLSGENSDANPTLHIPPYIINPATRMVTNDHTPIELTSKEFDLLLVFAQNPGYAFSREHLLQNVWGEDYFGSDRVVDDLVRRLRKKMTGLRIETIYGYGYRMMTG